MQFGGENIKFNKLILHKKYNELIPKKSFELLISNMKKNC